MPDTQPHTYNITKENGKAMSLQAVAAKRLKRERRSDIGALSRSAVLRALERGDARIGLEIMRELGLLRQAPRAADAGMAQAIAALLSGGAGATPVLDPSSQKPAGDGLSVSQLGTIFSQKDLESVGQLRFSFVEAAPKQGKPSVERERAPLLSDADVARIRDKYKEKNEL